MTAIAIVDQPVITLRADGNYDFSFSATMSAEWLAAARKSGDTYTYATPNKAYAVIPDGWQYTQGVTTYQAIGSETWMPLFSFKAIVYKTALSASSLTFRYSVNAYNSTLHPTDGSFGSTFVFPNPLYSGSGSSTGGASTGATTDAASLTPLTWFQARSLALSGIKIRRSGWVDRYLEYSKNLWWMQLLNSTTKVLGARAVVQGADWSEDNFRATDWVTDGITQTVDPAAVAQAQTITTKFP